MKKKPEIDHSDCINCGMCAQACPISALGMVSIDRQGKYRNVFPALITNECIGCGACEKACVMGCITMKD